MTPNSVNSITSPFAERGARIFEALYPKVPGAGGGMFSGLFLAGLLLVPSIAMPESDSACANRSFLATVGRMTSSQLLDPGNGSVSTQGGMASAKGGECELISYADRDLGTTEADLLRIRVFWVLAFELAGVRILLGAFEGVVT